MKLISQLGRIAAREMIKAAQQPYTPQPQASKQTASTATDFADILPNKQPVPPAPIGDRNIYGSQDGTMMDYPIPAGNTSGVRYEDRATPVSPAAAALQWQWPSHQGLPRGEDHPDNQQLDSEGRSPFDPYYNPDVTDREPISLPQRVQSLGTTPHSNRDSLATSAGTSGDNRSYGQQVSNHLNNPYGAVMELFGGSPNQGGIFGSSIGRDNPPSTLPTTLGNSGTGQFLRTGFGIGNR